MEAIKTYLDNVFAAYPQSNEVQALKRDMLANMEEKYIMLRQGGKSEHEAAYSVIADFGNIEEITAELGLDIKSGEVEEAIFLTWNDVQTYLTKAKQSGIWIGLGVWLIIAGVSSVVLLDNVFILFVTVAIAVTMFIVNGNKMSPYASYEEISLRLDSNTREKIETERARFMPSCTAMVAGGIALILLVVGAVTVIDFPIPLFLNIVGFSVFLFIIAGSYSSAFDILLGKGDYSNKEAVKKSGRIVGTLAAVYWPVATAIALWQLFIGNAYFWVVWPVAGVLFGGICGGIAVWYGTKDKDNK